MKIFTKNGCDGRYNSLDVHFTSACDNKCSHCIDSKYKGIGIKKPDVDAIANTVVKNSSGVDDVLFLGGEPCLYLKDLLKCIKIIRGKTSLKIYVTTAIPKICYSRFDLFSELLEIIDGINLSVQHHNEDIADEIRKTKSRYNRQSFYTSLPHKEKVRINLNIIKPYLYTKEDITNCLLHYDAMGFNEIKLSEIQHGSKFFVSFEKVFDVEMDSPFYGGCQNYINFPGIKTPLLLKRSCFICEETLKASLMDGVKAIYRRFNRPTNRYGIVYSNGLLSNQWI